MAESTTMEITEQPVLDKQDEISDLPSIEPQSLNTLHLKSLKRTYDMFLSNVSARIPDYTKALQILTNIKINDEYAIVKDMGSISSTVPGRYKPPPAITSGSSNAPPLLLTNTTSSFMDQDEDIQGSHSYPSGPGIKNIPGQTGSHLTTASTVSPQATQAYHEELASTSSVPQISSSLVQIKEAAGIPERYRAPSVTSNMSLAKRASVKIPKPEWHAPWKLMRVISGHLGWVRSVDIDPANEWFATGAGDRTIKIWDIASGTLRLTLTGHINTVRGIAVSDRHPYLFSCGEDKMIKCWDLEQNKVIRQYHGHLSAVYAIALHPTLDVLMTGGRDSTVRIWDMRTKANIHTLTGHQSTVVSVKSQANDPQVISGSHDSTIRFWDLAAGKCMSTLTHHKKSVRALALHPKEFTMASASADNIKKWKFPEGNFMHNLHGHKGIVNCLALNEENVLVSGGDNGALYFWDWKTGYNFQQVQSAVQPGSLDSENGVFAAAFDRTGLRLITCEADKTIKMWKEDDEASEESHPISNYKPDFKKY